MMSNNYQTQEYKEILEPIIFLDLFSFPVTAWEMWQYLNKKNSYSRIEDCLKDLIEKEVLQEMRGFYFLKGQEKHVATRLKRYNYSARKLKKARFFSKIFSLYPGVSMIAAANYIGSHNWRQESDIDFFIIAKDNHLWRSRLFCAGIAKLFFSRPTVKRKQDKICLSFYISQSAINLQPLELSGGDPYFKYWRQGLLPLFDRQSTWGKFLKANDRENNIVWKEDVKSGELVEDKKKMPYLEKLAKRFQLKIMPASLKEAAKVGEGVVINDQILKLYLKEKRRYFRDSFNLKKYEVFKKLN